MTRHRLSSRRPSSTRAEIYPARVVTRPPSDLVEFGVAPTVRWGNAGSSRPWTARRFRAWHSPNRGTAQLTSYEMPIRFAATLAVWTNNATPPVSAPTGDPADRLYAVLLRVAWNINGRWTITPATGAIAVVTAPTTVIAATAKTSPAVAARTKPVEVRPPAGGCAPPGCTRMSGVAVISEVLQSPLIVHIEVVSEDLGEWRWVDGGWTERHDAIGVRLRQVLRGSVDTAEGDVVELEVIKRGTGGGLVLDYYGIWTHVSTTPGTELVAFCDEASRDLRVALPMNIATSWFPPKPCWPTCASP